MNPPVDRRPAARVLWAGPAAVFIAVGASVFARGGEALDWSVFLASGALLPAAVVTAAAGERFAPTAATCLRLGLAVCGGAVFAALLAQMPPVRPGTPAALAVGQLAATFLLARGDLAGSPLRRAVWVAVAALMAWAAALRWHWWADVCEAVAAGPIPASMFALAVAATIASLRPAAQPPVTGNASPWWRAAVGGLDLAAVAALAWLSFGLTGFGTEGAPADHSLILLHHWSAFTGPAQAVREGGSPLRDVPAQYGFLSTLALAKLPTGSVWRSMHLLTGALHLVSAGVLYGLLRLATRRRGPGDAVSVPFALAATAAAMFFLPGIPGPQILGPWTYPATGPIRFVWCHALVAVLAWGTHLGRDGGPPRRRVMWAGSAVWVVAALWSFESAVYATAAWLPGFAWMAWERAGADPSPAHLWGRLRRAAAWFALPLGGLAAAVAAISLHTWRKTGHPPDFRCFVEFCLGAKAFALPADPDGPAWGLIGLSGLFAAGTARALAVEGGRGFPLAAGAWGVAWATASYYVGRSHPLNATNIAPTLIVPLAAHLYLVSAAARPRDPSADRPTAPPADDPPAPPPGPPEAMQPRAGDASAALIRAAAVPFLSVLLFAAYGSPREAFEYLRRIRHTADVERLMPVADPQLVALLATAGFRPDDPVEYLDVCGVMPRLPVLGSDRPRAMFRGWLPFDPEYLAWALPAERRDEYHDSFAARVRSGGWIVRRRDWWERFPWPTDWLFRALDRTHVRTLWLVSGDWEVMRYEYVGERGGADETGAGQP
jgi:hypothetical protein